LSVSVSGKRDFAEQRQRRRKVQLLASLAALPVADLAADHCALFLWATDPLLPRAIELIEAWGFEYKTVAGVEWLARIPRDKIVELSNHQAKPDPAVVVGNR
jgi:N6-adenosine-specific RNA methylase IME4